MLILHGENLVASRRKLKEEIDNFRLRFKGEVVRLEADQLDFGQVKQALEALSLFGQDRLVIIENLFSGPPKKEKQQIIAYLNSQNPSKNLILWEKKKIDGRVLAPFKTQIIQFDLTQVIFRLLDSLAPDNAKISLYLLHDCLKQDSPEMVFYLLIRQIRLLIIAADLGEKGLKSLPDWRKGKLIHQAKKFGLNRLISLNRQLLKIDWQQKSGQAVFDLATDLDLLLASL